MAPSQWRHWLHTAHDMHILQLRVTRASEAGITPDSSLRRQHFKAVYRAKLTAMALQAHALLISGVLGVVSLVNVDLAVMTLKIKKEL